MSAVPIIANELQKFSFSKPDFDGEKFYKKYNNADFLKDSQNIVTILAKTKELTSTYIDLGPNKSLQIEGMFLEPNVPLVVKKSELVNESDMDQDDFTLRRLLGLTAAKAYQCGIPVYCPQSEALGLDPSISYVKNNRRVTDYRLYLSAISGAEYFVTSFDYLPFLIALRKFNLDLIEELLQIANIRDSATKASLVMRCARDFNSAKDTASNAMGFNLVSAIKNAGRYTSGVKCFFKNLDTIPT